MMLNPIEAELLNHGMVISIAGQPVMPPYDPTSDQPRVAVSPAAFQTLGMVASDDVTGMANVYATLLTVSFDRRVVDNKQLGIPDGFFFDQATVTVDGLDLRVDTFSPRFFGAEQIGWDLQLGR